VTAIIGLAIFKIYHTILKVNESKFYFTKDDIEITISEGSYEVRNINEFLTRAILRNRRPYHDALDICDTTAITTTATITTLMTTVENTLRANYNMMRCEIKYAYRINFGKPNSIGSLLEFSSKRILRP